MSPDIDLLIWLISKTPIRPAQRRFPHTQYLFSATLNLNIEINQINKSTFR